MDNLVALPETSSSQDALMVVIDRLIKRAKFIKTKTTATSEDTTEFFMKNYVKDHGQSKSIVSDCDSKYTLKFWSSVAL
ncbi:hypothetical protein CCR75_008002 [Bremia lactucae]|uniref:Integrase catalytic domain-containing protein n=1 Tax=Bremia lactucae TaxID=4779 RepID=A0A976FGX4_BRELC|nr:hypothetical protein CCR75_008002 [Bremia lactucae]